MNKIREIKKAVKANGSITLDGIKKIQIEANHQRHHEDKLPRSKETRKTLTKLIVREE